MLVGVGDDFEHVYGRLNLSVIVRSRMEKVEGDTFWIGEGGPRGSFGLACVFAPQLTAFEGSESSLLLPPSDHNLIPFIPVRFIL